MATEAFGKSMDTVIGEQVQQTAAEMSYANRRKGESLKAWQRRLRKKLLTLLAIEGEPRKPAPVRFTEQAPRDGYLLKRGYLQAADGLALPFYLLEPDPKPARLGVCLAIHGHGPGKNIPVDEGIAEKSRYLIDEGERDYAVQAAREGYLTISPDLRGFGELMLLQDLAEGKAYSCEQLACRYSHLGRTLLGQRVSDMMQLLDWALARKDTDAGRVVVTGNSGGGTMTLFTSVVDERVAAAAPSCYFSTFADSILAMYHCPCNFVPGLRAMAEMADLAGLFAPRPMLVVAGTKDVLFPIDAVRAGYKDLRNIYTDAGAADNVELYEGTGGHRYYKSRVWPFFAEKLSR